MFGVISVYFNVRNILPNSGTFPPEHPVYAVKYGVYFVIPLGHSVGPIPVAAQTRRGFAAARLLELWVRIPLGAWMSVSCDCRVLSGRGL